MTITSDPMSPLATEHDTDLLPGSTDVEWAERAYRHRPSRPTEIHRRVPRARRSRNRGRVMAAAAAVLVVMAGMTVLLIAPWSSSSTRPAPNAPAVVTQSAHVIPGHATVTPPLLRPATIPQLGVTAPSR
jgi:hypothetical protein